jgi:hypothetical protein
MNRYILLHRLTGPAILLLLGVVALMHQAGLVRFSIFVPLMLILIGVIKLAERAVLAQEPNQGAPYPGAPYQGGGYPQGQYPGTQYPQGPYPTTNVSPPPAAPTHDFGNDPEGGKQ